MSNTNLLFASIPYNAYSFELIYDNKQFREALYQFLKESKVTESLNFIQMVDDYCLTRATKNRKALASTIIDRFIRVDADEEINILSGTRNELLSKYEKAKKENYFPNNLFQEAYESVFMDLKYDLFPRFIRSELFLDIAKKEHSKIGNEEFKRLYTLSDEETKKTEDRSLSYRNKIEWTSEHIPKMEVIPKPISINFTEEELKKVSDKLDSDKLNDMIIEMMKPFSGIKNCKPKLKLKMLKTIKPIKKRRYFYGNDAKKWIADYLNVKEDDTIIKDVIQLLIAKNVIIPYKEKKDIYYFGIKKKVVIIGCGFGGSILSKGLQDDFDVTVIDRKTEYEYNLSFHLLFHDPSKIHELTIPITKIAPKCTIIHGEVLHVSPDVVYMKDRAIPFDYLIVATGSHYVIPFPIKVSKQLNEKEMMSRSQEELLVRNKKRPTIIVPYSSSLLLDSFQKLREAKNIVVIGGGPVACEVFGEIAHYYHHSADKITLITQCNILLERIAPDAHQAMFDILSSYPKTKFLFNRRITRIEDNLIYFKLNERNVKNEEQYIEADFIVICVGLRPNTKVLKHFFCDSLTDFGYVYTNEYFQIKKGIHKNRMSVNEEEMYRRWQEKLLAAQLEMQQKEIPKVKEEMLDEKNAKIQIDKLFQKMFEDEPSEPVKDEHANAPVYPNIFAIGDIVESPDEKLAYFANLHANHLTKILHAMEFEEGEAYKKAKFTFGKFRLQFISAGPEKAIGVKANRLVSVGGVVHALKKWIETHYVVNTFPK